MFRHLGRSSRNWLVLLGVVLTACATSSSLGREEHEPSEVVSSWQEARADPSCVVPLYDEERCALWRCQDVVEVEAPSVELALSTQSVRPPLGNPSRWWGLPVAAPTHVEPVFEIPWHNWRTREQLAHPKHPLGCMLPPEPLEKHHIFPQQEELARWFKGKGIDIHAFTIALPRSFHQWLHSGGPKGGQWNEAWREFRRKNSRATAEDMWRFAGELMMRFRVNGPLMSYYCE
jgi:uncharacterized lipoprotein (TIGR02269 family)